jgi:exodeoxyribonuclease VII small subunit
MASFEDQMAELEKVVDRLEQGDLTLEENVTLFERGVKLSDACKAQSASAESRIQVLLDPEAGGVPRVEDLAVTVADEQDEEDADELENEYDDGRL